MAARVLIDTSRRDRRERERFRQMATRSQRDFGSLHWGVRKRKRLTSMKSTTLQSASQWRRAVLRIGKTKTERVTTSHNLFLSANAIVSVSYILARFVRSSACKILHNGWMSYDFTWILSPSRWRTVRTIRMYANNDFSQNNYGHSRRHRQ